MNASLVAEFCVALDDLGTDDDGTHYFSDGFAT
jgi:hypothetical protein